jgi:ribosomal protein S18 acetylase RimI-like enzyme
MKRARSVTALSTPNCDLEQQIAWCERFYGERELPPLFRLSPASRPETLDEALAERGYEVVETTAVQVAELSAGLPAVSQGWEVAPVAAHLWVNAVGNFRQSSLGERQSHLWRLNMLGESIHQLSAFDRGSIVGTGAVVIDGGYAGIVDMHTREDYRGRGIGTAVLGSLLEHALANGIERAWLGVLAENEPALGLCAKLGFQTVYRYWYRRKPSEA